METILNSIDFIITTKENNILLIKRDNEPEIGKIALPGGVQNSFESFEAAVVRVLKKKLGLVSKIKDNEIEIEQIGTYPFKQIKTYDSGKDIRGGNTTVFHLDMLNISSDELKEYIPREVIICDRDNIPNLAFEHNNFLRDFFFFHKNYTVAQMQDIGITVDIVIMTVKDRLLKVLLSKRSKEPFKGYYTLPGGFVDKNKSLDESAVNILKRDTNIDNAFLEQLYTFGDIQRDSRGRVITTAYYALIDYSQLDLVYSGKYEDMDWFSLSDLNKKPIAFDHKKIIEMAIDRIKNKIEYTNIAFQLLPEKFTLAELQEVYETILERELDKRNFRKKIAELDMLEELDEYKKQGRMRPAKYHRFKERSKETVFKADKWI